MQISPVGNRVANIDPDAETNGSISGVVAIMDRNLLLYLHGAPNGPSDAFEYDQQRIATRLHYFAAMLFDCWVD
jgi:hypothetical protein